MGGTLFVVLTLATAWLYMLPGCLGVSGPLTGMGAFCKDHPGQKVAAGWCDAYIQCSEDGSDGTVHKCGEEQLYSLDARDCVERSQVWCPNGKRGHWGKLMDSGGVVAIHCTLVPYTSRVLAWQRGQAWWEQRPEPGMAIPGSEQLNSQGLQWEYLSALQEPLSNTYLAYQVDPPFCSGQSQLPDGKILVCGGDYGNMSGRQGEEQGIDVCRTFKCWDDDISKCMWENVPERLSVKRWYPTQLQIPAYDDNGPFTMIVGGSAVGQDPSAWGDVYQQLDWLFPYSRTGKMMYTSEATQFTARLGNMNMYPFMFLLPAQHDNKYQVFMWGINYGEIVTVENPITTTDHNPVETLRVLPELEGEGEDTNVATTYPAGGCAVMHALEYPWDESAVVTMFGGLPGTFNQFNDFVNNVDADTLAVQFSWSMDVMDPDAEWEREEMPDHALLRQCVLLPTGVVALIQGVRSGKETASNNGAACTKGQQWHAWLYNHSAPTGERYMQDAALEPTWRAYHGCSVLLPDGSLYSAGCETGEVPADTSECVGPRDYHFSVDGYVPMDNYISMLEDTRPKLVEWPERITLGDRDIVVKVTGPVDECSLSVPGASTHLMNMSQRVAFLRTRRLKPWRRSRPDEPAELTLQAPPNAMVFPNGPALLFCMYQRGAYSEGMWVTVDLPK